MVMCCRRVSPDGLHDLGGAHVAAHGVDSDAPVFAGGSTHREDGGEGTDGSQTSTLRT